MRKGLGLPDNENRLEPHDPAWAEAFAREAAAIRDAAGSAVVAVEHFGSTAVPGLCAKPIIDLLVGVRREADWHACRAPLEALGYEYDAGAGVPEHHVFRKGHPRTHLAHVTVFGAPSWIRNLYFRDRLRSDPALREAYARLKEDAVAAHPRDRAAYVAFKGPWIERVKQEA